VLIADHTITSLYGIVSYPIKGWSRQRLPQQGQRSQGKRIPITALNAMAARRTTAKSPTHSLIINPPISLTIQKGKEMKFPRTRKPEISAVTQKKRKSIIGT